MLSCSGYGGDGKEEEVEEEVEGWWNGVDHDPSPSALGAKLAVAFGVFAYRKGSKSNLLTT